MVIDLLFAIQHEIKDGLTCVGARKDTLPFNRAILNGGSH